MTNVRKTFSKKVKQAVDKRNIIKYNVKHVETLSEREKRITKNIKNFKKVVDTEKKL